MVVGGYRWLECDQGESATHISATSSPQSSTPVLGYIHTYNQLMKKKILALKTNFITSQTSLGSSLSSDFIHLYQKI